MHSEPRPDADVGEPRNHTGGPGPSEQGGQQWAGDGVRMDTGKGKHRHPDGVRYSVASKPGLDPDTGDVNPPNAHQDVAASPRTTKGEEGRTARTPTAVSRCAGSPVAEVRFPPTAAQAKVVSLDHDHDTDRTGPTVKIVVDSWPDGPHAVVAREMVASWRCLSRRLAGQGHAVVRVVAPLHPHFYSTPGLFGSPSQFGEDGDDHWRIVAGPKPGYDNTQGTLTLVRRGEPGEQRKRHLIRAGGNHLLVSSRAYRRGHRAAVIGFLRPCEGRRDPVPVIESRTCANPTTAVCEALVEALAKIAPDIDVTVWLSDGLVRSAVRGWYADARGEEISKYRGAKPPEITAALDQPVTRIAKRRGTTKLRGTSQGGAVAQEIVGMAKAVEAVRAFCAIDLDEAAIARIRESWREIRTVDPVEHYRPRGYGKRQMFW